MVSFDCTKTELQFIKKIVDRVVKRFPKASRIDLTMDLSACHCNGTPLDLRKLLDADDFNFAHDVIGIHRHIDHDTGTLRDCFLPRCAR